MLLDELAAAIVGAEADDLPELARIHEALQRLGDVPSVPAKALALAEQAARKIEQLILGEAEDELNTLAEVGRMVASMQRVTEGKDEAAGTDEIAGPATSVADAGAPGGTAGASEPPTTPSTTPSPAPPSAADAAASAAEALAADPALVGEFVTESLDHLERAEGALLNIESNPDDTEEINGIFRAFHTIKGTSGFLGLTSINRLAHKAETLLDRARQGQIRLVGLYADLSLESTDMLRKLVQQVRAQAAGEPTTEPPGLGELLARLEAPETTGADGTPPPRVGDILVGQGRADRDAVEAAAAGAGEEPIGERLIHAGAATAQDVAGALRAQRQMGGGSGATLRVSMTRLDTLMDMVGELVIAQAMVSQDPVVRDSASQALQRKTSQLDKITRELQDLTLSMRMVPLKGTFQKMARLVRDLARKSGKVVQFETEGEDTEIDRNMVDAINDPLVHMMRNAVDHGLEPPDERVRAGKPEAGRVVLRAYHAAGKVVIEVQDDGRGLDAEKLLAKGIERGLVEPNRELTRSEIYELIFAPGFSTAAKVTDVSGRGVGMDVVRKNIEALRGRVEIASELGRGSTFAINLPLTLAIIDGMLIKVGVEHYILPTLSIEQSFQPDAASISTVSGRGELVLLRGRLIPIYRLHELFGVPGAVENPTEGLLVVVEHEGERCALLADELLGQQQVVIKSLGAAMGEIQGVSGAAILGDGRVGLIVDVGGVIRLAQGEYDKAA